MRNKEQMDYKAIRKLEKAAGTILFILLFVSLLLVFVPMRVSGSSAGVEGEERYHELEMSFLDVLDMRLRGYGYPDSGLTLNSIVYADGSRCYYVRIHHVRITDSGTEAWEELKLRIADLSFPIENCRVIYEIIP